MTTALTGYRGLSKAVLERSGAGVWSDVEIRAEQGTFRGIVLPRCELAGDRHIVLKLPCGYSLGVAANAVQSIKVHGRHEVQFHATERPFPVRRGKPEVRLLGTGGTIASRFDVRTGAVIPLFAPGELHGLVPELSDYCNLHSENLFAVFSENIDAGHYQSLVRRISEVLAEGVDGIVIAHGTDTMHHTAALLSFMVQQSPVPIVMVGSQRSSDRPSSDAALNLTCGVKAAAEGDIAGVIVCMFGPTSDEYCLLHRGTRVRKMHTSYRSTFRTIGDVPLGMINPREIRLFRKDYLKRDKSRAPVINPAFESRVTLLYHYPNMQPDVVDAVVERGYRGIVIAGTGLGHVNRPLYPALRRAVDRGVHIFMTAQTLWGYVQMYVYETGREIMTLGVVPAGNMLPETAYMKLCWVLGQTDDRAEVQRLMLTPIAGEITPREPYNGYLVFQGEIPEVQEFLRSIRR